MSPQIIPLSHPNKISNIIWDSDLTAPTPFKIKSDCLKEIPADDILDNYIDITKLSTVNLPNCTFNISNVNLMTGNQIINAGNITDYDNFYLTTQSLEDTLNKCVTCDGNIIKKFQARTITVLNDTDVLKWTVELENKTLPYDNIEVSHCIPQQDKACWGCSAAYYDILVLSNFQNLGNGKLTGTCTVEQYKTLVKKSENKIVFNGVMGQMNADPGKCLSFKIELLNSVQTAALREPARALTLHEYNTQHNIVDDDTQVIAPR